MTTRHNLTETQWGEERTLIDPCSLRNEPRFTRPPRPRPSSFSLPPDRTTLGFLCLGVALTLVAILAVREHREANTLREALQIAEMTRAPTESRQTHSTRRDPRETASLDVSPAALPAVGDRARAERQAADFLVANNYRAALGQFASLLTEFPDDHVYHDLIVALQWRLRCDPSGRAGGHRCN
jgi:hypothetical protein